MVDMMVHMMVECSAVLTAVEKVEMRVLVMVDKLVSVRGNVMVEYLGVGLVALLAAWRVQRLVDEKVGEMVAMLAAQLVAQMVVYLAAQMELKTVLLLVGM